MINKKDIIGLNQEIGESGDFQNESSLDFALSIIREKKSWLYELSYLIRSLLVDHVFRDGNKRTSLILILYYLDDKGMDYNKEDIANLIHKIAKKNIKDVNKISRIIKNDIIK